MIILYILKHNPWGVGGGCYASRNYLEAFSDIYAGAAIDVCICSEYLCGADVSEFPNMNFIGVAPRTTIGRYFSPITGIMHRYQQVASKLIEGNSYELCIFDHSSIAATLVDKCAAKGIKTVVINHNCEVDYFRDNNRSWLWRRLLLPVVGRNECKAYKECTVSIFLTAEDKQQFKTAYGETKSRGVVMGCFCLRGGGAKAPQLSGSPNERLRIIISGTIGNIQNMDGINLFIRELYPLLPTDVDVVIAGKNPPESLLREVAKLPNVEVVANPKNMDEVVRECDIFLCPTRLGGGIKLRVMDGFCNGLIVVSHSVSARGYRVFAEDGYLEEYTTVAEFHTSIIRSIERIKSRRVSKNDVASFANQQFGYDVLVDRLKSIL